MSAAPAPVAVRCADGRELAGLLIEAAAPRGAITVNGATGYRREFYLRFAAYCAARGYHTLAYDYRGVGASARAPLRREAARMSDWGHLDMPAALDYLAQRFPGLPLFTVGHSVGGQLAAAMPNQARARAHVMVAASTGYWRDEPVPMRWAAAFFWFMYGPLMLRLCGYVPHSPLWSGQSLPPGVYRQWRAWCLHPQHFGPDLARELPDNQFAHCSAPVLALCFSDDPIANPTTVEALLAFYPRARIERRWIAPAEAGGRSIGHGGFFAARHRDSLWRSLLDWIDAR